jgi:putative DNA primase/helicase
MSEGPGKYGQQPPEIPSQLVIDRMYANELGDGLMFADLCQDRFVHNITSGEWLAWQGQHWAVDEAGDAKSAVERVAQRYLEEAVTLVTQIDAAIKAKDQDAIGRLKHLQGLFYKRVAKLRSARGRLNCLEFAHTNSEKALAVTGDKIDQQPWLFPCANGVWDLRTGETHPGRQDEWCLKASPHKADGLFAPAPHWEAFIASIFEDPGIDEETGRPNGELVIEYVQRLLGYAMTGLSVEHVLPIFWGQGRNGKGTLVETINYVAGPLSGPIQAEMLLSQSRDKNAAAPSPEIMDLRGRRFAWASETDEGRHFSPSKIKWFSGGDTLTGRAPHDRYITTFRPTHTLFLLTNNKPHAPADDFAFWERVHLIPFKWSFVDRPPAAPNERRADKNLPDRLKDEAPGILAWLVRGCLAWQEQGLNPPACVKAATQDYRREEDVLADWMDECCFVDPSVASNASTLYDNFKQWWEDNMGRKVPAQKTFGRMMAKRFHREKKGTFTYFGIRPLLDMEKSHRA